MKREADKEKFWRKTVAEACGSGQSVREFCRKRGLKENLFYHWRREIKTREAEVAKKGEFVELVRPAGGKAGAGVSLRIDDRLSIVLDRGFDAMALKAVLACLCVPACDDRGAGSFVRRQAAVGEVAPA